MVGSYARNLSDSDLTSLGNWPRPIASMNSEPAWRSSARKQFQKIRELDEGWDGYRAKPIRRDTIEFAQDLLEDIMALWSQIPPPSIVPTTSGGVQIEWHEKGIDLELHIAGPYDCEMWFEDQRGVAPRELHLTNDFSPLQELIYLLFARP